MRRWHRALRGGLIGAALGAGSFTADFIGAVIAIGMLIDPRIETFYLVAIAGVAFVVIGTAAGCLIGLSWPPRWRVRIRRGALVAGIAVALVAVVTAGFAGRVGRRLKPPPPVVDAQPPPTSVLWVVIDTLRSDTLYGDAVDFPSAPRLRQLAAESLVFTDTETAAGWTLPSMATLFTGLHPTALEASKLLPDWAPTVAERLHAAGYATHAVVDNALLEPRNGYAAGFESWFQKSGLRFAFSLPGFRATGAWMRRKVRERWPTYYYGAPRLTDVALSVLDTPRERPLFLYVHYMDPHYPYYPHPAMAPDPATAEAVTLPWRTLRRQGGELRPGQLQFLLHRYETEVRVVDGELGRLLDGWNATYGRDSLVMVTSDHGEEFLDHGSLGHGNNLHPELVRAPLLLRLPEAVLGADGRGRRIDHPVGQVDLLPTTLDALGVSPDVGSDGVQMQGRSWLPWLRGEEGPPSRALVAKQTFRGKRITRWREGDWVRIHTVDIEANSEAMALYEKRNDDKEHHDLAALHGERMALFGQRLDALIESTREFSEAGSGDARPNEDALRALGYVQ